MTDYPPYVDAYGLLKELFQKIKEAAVPPKFTQDFLHTVLGLKSSSFRPMIPFLKRIGFLDDANVPTQVYINFRDDSMSGIVMFQKIKKAYSQLFSANEYAYKLNKEQIVSKLNTVLGTSKEDKTTPKIASTFLELVSLASPDGKLPKEHSGKVKKEGTPVEFPEPSSSNQSTKLGISYTINLNLPATPDVEVFNAIFKSLKENLLR